MPLPAKLLQFGNFDELGPALDDSSVLISVVQNYAFVLNNLDREGKTLIADLRGSFEARFLDLIRKGSEIEYHSWAGKTRWSFLLPGAFSLIYPTRAFVDEVVLSDDALNLLGQFSGLSDHHRYPEFEKAA